jgi:hypothetical protein
LPGLTPWPSSRVVLGDRDLDRAGSVAGVDTRPLLRGLFRVCDSLCQSWTLPGFGPGPRCANHKDDRVLGTTYGRCRGLTPGPCCARDTAAAWETKANATLPGLGPGPRCVAQMADLVTVTTERPRRSSCTGPSLRGNPYGRQEVPQGPGRQGSSERCHLAALRSEPPWLQAMLLPVEPTGYPPKSLSAIPTAHRLLLGARLPFANVHRYQTGRRGNHSQQANAAGGSVPSSWLHPGWPYEITPYLVANLPTHRNDAQLSPEQPQHRPQE